MADLRDCFERAGFQDVSTYIQSGNVLFETTEPARSLEARIEKILERRFEVPLVVVVRSRRQLDAVVTKAPAGFGTQPKRFHSDVLFLKAPLTARQVMRILELRAGVDQAWPGPGVVYFQRLSAQRTRSRLSRIVSTPEYQLMTIRSWQTTQKLHELL